MAATCRSCSRVEPPIVSEEVGVEEGERARDGCAAERDPTTFAVVSVDEDGRGDTEFEAAAAGGLEETCERDNG